MFTARNNEPAIFEQLSQTIARHKRPEVPAAVRQNGERVIYSHHRHRGVTAAGLSEMLRWWT